MPDRHVRESTSAPDPSSAEAAASTGSSVGNRTRPRAAPRDPAPGRRRPGPTSSLAPAPESLMPPLGGTGPGGSRATGEGSETGPAGRRQHHRAPRGASGTDTGEDLVYLSGRIPRRLRDELHVRAIGEGRPVVDLMRDALRGYLDHHQGPPRA